MARTASEIVLGMIAQLRVLDPSASADVGTPERKIIDTVAVEIANNEVDLDALQSGLDIDSKFGTNLDHFLALFRFARQQATPATGFVTFVRDGAPATVDIRVPAGTRTVAPGVVASGQNQPAQDVFFATTFDVVLPAGQSSVSAPIKAINAGASGNVAANSITEIVGTFALGITSVHNDTPTSGGLDTESDDEVKVRFKNTVFRNLAGTEDQYLALAVSTAFTSKAVVVGPISRYREYIQVPAVDDATVDPESALAGNGNAGEYTTALSTIPFSKFTYSTVPFFITNGLSDAETIFLRPDTDFVMNTDVPTRDRGDTFRFGQDPGDPDNTFRPNVTFLNVLDPAVPDEALGVRAGDVVLFEHSYMSSASRNDFVRSVTNAVDVFLDGGNLIPVDSIIAVPRVANAFVNNATDRFHFENFRRRGEAEHRPVVGNLFSALYFQPVDALPPTILAGNNAFYLGHHYWAIHDVSDIGGTVRTRNGIEWSISAPSQAEANDPDDATTWDGPTVLELVSNSILSLEIDSYTYDKNINDLQAAMDGAKQVTTDVLAHKAKLRYFKLDITVMYSAGSNVAEVNTAIHDAVATFFAGQYFGTTIQLSDLLQVIHNVPNVDNVRWSRDVPGSVTEVDTTRNRVIECNVNGTALLSLVIDRATIGTPGAGTHPQAEQLRLYRTGGATGGTFVLTRAATSTSTSALAWNVAAGPLQVALRTLTGDGSLTVTGTGDVTDPWIVQYSAVGLRDELTLTSNLLTGGPTIFKADFFLEDDELPALPEQALTTDNAAGLIIRPRAQNTWVNNFA